MTIDQTIAYLGGMDDRTFKSVCPVFPLDMGANIVRYRRTDIDAWVASLRQRGPKVAAANCDTPAPIVVTPDDGADRPQSAVERARERAAGRGKCRKTA